MPNPVKNVSKEEEDEYKKKTITLVLKNLFKGEVVAQTGSLKIKSS